MRELLAGIRTIGDAIDVIGKIRRLVDLPELCREEHAQHAIARWHKLEGAAA